MNEYLQLFRGAMTLDIATFEKLRAMPNAMKRGIFVLLISFLIAGVASFVINLVGQVQPFTQERADQFTDSFLETFRMWEQFVPQDDQFQREFFDQFEENFRLGTQIGVEIDALPRPMPRAVGGFLSALGQWLSNPFSHLGLFLAYGIDVLLVAKLAGGRGQINQFFGLTALYAVPNILGVFSFIPIVGSAIALVGVIWGWIVYIRALQVSQDYTAGKAILVALLPLILLFLIGLILVILFSALIAAAVSSVPAQQ
jgi:hypothetical protein